MKTKTLSEIGIDVAIFLIAAAGTHFALSMDRPISAVLIFLTGVILISARSGLFGALFAAVSASVTYNFLLSEPVFQFGITTVDEAVPLLAFNISALVAGTLVGRLRDTANRAYSAQAEMAFLLTVSDRLQSAIKVEEVEAAIRGIIPTQSVRSIEIFLVKGDSYYRPSTGEVEFDLLKPLIGENGSNLTPHQAVIVELEGARGQIGIAKFHLAEGRVGQNQLPNLQSIAALLALATERCLLLEELTEARALTRSEALKDALLSSVSHDLRTPITVIQTAAGALSSSRVTLSDEERNGLLGSILAQCRRLDRYTSELLDVGRIQAGVSADQLETLDLAEVVHLAINHAKSTNPQIRIERSPTQDAVFVTANPVMLEQAIFNIIDNAQKFGGAIAPVKIAVTCEGEQAVVAISDHGPGIAARDMPRIFKRFFKGSPEGEQAGMGLGLFIAKGFVEAFSGSIDVASPLEGGRGTRVSIRLPLAPAREIAEPVR